MRLRCPMAGETGVLPWWGERWHKPLFLGFVITLALGLISPLITPNYDWTAVVFVMAFLSAFVTLGRQLPLQNVVLVTVIFVLASTFVTTAAARSNDWRLVVLWTTVLIDGWVSAQFVMRRADGRRFYGWGILFLAIAIAAGFGGILYTNAMMAGLSAFTTMIILLAVFPLLMNKRPVKPPVGWEPIAMLAGLAAWIFLR